MLIITTQRTVRTAENINGVDLNLHSGLTPLQTTETTRHKRFALSVGHCLANKVHFDPDYYC